MGHTGHIDAAHTSALAHQCVGRRQFVVAAAGAGLALVALPQVGHTSAAHAATAAGQTYTPGTYSATALGRKGPVGVEVSFSESAIESIEVTESHETPRIAAGAFAQIPALVVEYQSLGIDTVTGATFSSLAVLSAVADCVEQAGGDVAALQAAPGPEPRDEDVEIDVDVLVVGSGSAGMTCAIECALQGAKVAVMEKCANLGGNALVCGGVLGWINSPDELRPDMTDGYAAYFAQTLATAAEMGVPQEVIDEVQAEYDAYYAAGNTKVFDSAKWNYVYGIVASGGMEFSQEEYDAYTTEENDLMFDWLNQTDIEWKPLTGVAGYPWPENTSPVEGECGAGYFLAFDRFIEAKSLPIDFVMATPAEELISEGGRVTGAKGTCADGTRYVVRASKAVVLATGGFSGNPDMIKKYDFLWDFADDAPIPTDNAYGHTGDGMVLAQSVGSPEPESVYTMILPFANAADLSVESIVGDSGNALLVNLEAKRFVDESQGRNYITTYEMQQTDGKSFLISDKNNCLIENGLNMFNIEEEMLLLMNRLYKADTIEELAEQCGLDPQTLAETVATYNEYAAQGSDPDFGRTMFNESSPVVEPPFYACPCTWAMHITGGGVAIDDTRAVLDAQGERIPGLYAIGELNGNAGITNMAEGIVVADAIMA